MLYAPVHDFVLCPQQPQQQYTVPANAMQNACCSSNAINQCNSSNCNSYEVALGSNADHAEVKHQQKTAVMMSMKQQHDHCSCLLLISALSMISFAIQVNLIPAFWLATDMWQARKLQ